MSWELSYLHTLQDFSNPIIDKIMVLLSTLGNAGVIWILAAVILLISKKYRKTGIQMIAAINAIANADTLIIGGTSLVVYPAAGLINYFNGKNIVLINKSSTQADSKADLIINDDIAKVMEEAVNIIKGD